MEVFLFSMVVCLSAFISVGYSQGAAFDIKEWINGVFVIQYVQLIPDEGAPSFSLGGLAVLSE